MATKIVDKYVSGSKNNNSVNILDHILYDAKEGTIFISPSNAVWSSAIIIDGGGTTITNDTASGGINVGDSTSITGTIFMTSKGPNLKKGEFSENSKSAKIFTYKETVLMESIPKEVASEVAGKSLGVTTNVSIEGTNQSVGMDGAFPMVTDFAPGPVPHFHTISTKHVHRIEPAYLYTIPEPINIILGALKQLQSFYKA